MTLQSNVCDTLYFGEQQDYSVNVSLQKPCSGNLTPGNTVFSANPVCSSTAFTLSLQNYTLYSGITYQWQSSLDNSTWSNTTCATDAEYTASQTADTWYKCEVTCTGITVASNAIDVTVNPLPTITPADTTTFCQGGSVVLNTDSTGLSYQWQNYGYDIDGATSASYIAFETGSYSIIMANINNCSDTSQAVTVTANPVLPVIVDISPTANPACSGSDVTFTALATNGGTDLSYLWEVNGVNAGTNSSTYTYIPLNNDTVTCLSISNTTCATGNHTSGDTIKMTVNNCLYFSISGYVKYENKDSTAIQNTDVYLANSSDIIFDNTITDNTGYYIFDNIVNGTYKLSVLKKMPGVV